MRRLLNFWRDQRGNTAIIFGLAVIPLVIAGNLPGHEIEHPMAVVIVGGLITSTFRNLFIVPTLYLRIGHGREIPSRPEGTVVA